MSAQRLINLAASVPNSDSMPSSLQGCKSGRMGGVYESVCKLCAEVERYVYEHLILPVVFISYLYRHNPSRWAGRILPKLRTFMLSVT
jgi:hypothetical protein